MAPTKDPQPRDLIAATAFFISISVLIFVAVALAQFDFALDLTIYREAVQLGTTGANVYGERFSANQLPFAYPPTALVLLVWTALPVGSALVALWAGSCAALLLAVRAVVTPERTFARFSPRDTRATFLTTLILVTFPVLQSLNLGQVNIVLMTLVILDAIGLRTSRFGGVLIGLATCIKLTPGLFILWLWVSGRRRAAGQAVGTVVLVAALSFVLFPESALGYIAEGARLSVSNNAPLATQVNQSLIAVLVRAGLDGVGAKVVVYVLCICLVVAALIVSRRLLARGDLALAVVIVGLVSASVAPIAWIHHFVWLPLVAVALWTRPSGGRWDRTVAAGLYAVALIPLAAVVDFSAVPALLPLSSAYFLVTVGIVAWLLSQTRASRQAG